MDILELLWNRMSPSFFHLPAHNVRAEESFALCDVTKGIYNSPTLVTWPPPAVFFVPTGSTSDLVGHKKRFSFPFFLSEAVNLRKYVVFRWFCSLSLLHCSLAWRKNNNNAVQCGNAQFFTHKRWTFLKHWMIPEVKLRLFIDSVQRD